MLTSVVESVSEGFWTQKIYGDIPLWVFCIGILGQAMFFSRFLVQWVASEMVGKSIIPMVFWYLSLAGGSILFLYAYLREDLVIMLGQGIGTFVYLRNINLRMREGAREE